MLASCLKIVDKHPDGLCKCGSPENVQHVMFICEKNKAEREQLFKEVADFFFSF